MNPDVTAFFDEATNTASYVVRDPGSPACAIVDSVLDLDYAAGRIATESTVRYSSSRKSESGSGTLTE